MIALFVILIILNLAAALFNFYMYDRTKDKKTAYAGLFNLAVAALLYFTLL